MTQDSLHPAPAPADAGAPGPAALPLDRVLVTERLALRPPRPPDHAAENRALHALAAALGASPRAALDALMREAIALCRPDGNATAGVSLLERDRSDGGELFRWTAMAGRLSHAVGGSTPRGFSPCGVCVDEDRPVLFARPDLRYTYFQATGVTFVEGLVLPFRVGGRIAGTIWIVSHDDRRAFDVEDVRLMTSLADFTGAVYAQLAALEAADVARAEREQLLQTVSHEWRTPLGVVTGMLALVADGVAGPVVDEQRTLLRRARAAADHLLALVTEALASARPGAAAPAPHLETLDVARLVADAVAMVEPSARAAGLDFQVRLPSAPTLVRADALHVRQILLNLLANAVKFTRRGGVEVHVDASVAGEGGSARVLVRDTGIGIAPHHLERAFERYWRAAEPAARPGAGFTAGEGLGLAISRELARGMGGDLTTESEVGRGSTFTLTLPSA